MTVVAILAIVGGIAAPSFRSMIDTMNTKSTAFDLMSDLTAARSEAIKRNATASIAPIGGDWSKGWQVTSNGDTVRQRSAPGASISVSAPSGGVSFGPSGRLTGLANTDNLTWTVSSTTSGATPRCVVITPTGAARAKSGGC
jgi:type IV fimbrial biogenesis protein FimT